MASAEEIRRSLGLRRPLEEYAPRTQRRYRAAYNSGITAQAENRRDYINRADNRARRIGAELRTMGMDSDGSHSPAGLKELRDYLGSWKKVEDLLSAQLGATKEYVAVKSTAAGHVLRSSDWENYDSEERLDLEPYRRYRGKAA